MATGLTRFGGVGLGLDVFVWLFCLWPVRGEGLVIKLLLAMRHVLQDCLRAIYRRKGFKELLERFVICVDACGTKTTGSGSDTGLEPGHSPLAWFSRDFPNPRVRDGFTGIEAFLKHSNGAVGLS